MISEKALTGPAAWTSSEMSGSDRWMFELSDQHRDEIHAAVDATGTRAINDLSEDAFALPTLGPALRELHQDVTQGRGFVLIRGMPVDRMSREEIIRAYMGVGRYFGTAVPQNGKGHLVGHVRDIGADPMDPAVRVYTTNYRQPFHTDSCDIVGLLCLQPAKSGGASAISSSTSVVARMAKDHPELLDVMRQPFTYDRKGEVPAGFEETYEMPVVHYHDEKVCVFYARDFIESAEARFPERGSFSDLQKKALDTFDSYSRSDEYRLDMDFRQGDIQFLHNHQILHARTSYEDFEEPERKRHLVRLWLSAHGPRALPPVYALRYGPLDGAVRGGIYVPDVPLSTPLHPE